ncbi:MAG TPA: hypothetical protein VGE47_06045, partial [Burkholderiaceae bacterium]
NQNRPIAELAARDPRSNSMRLSWRERFRLRMGKYECVAEKLLPDGSIQRGPGKLVPSELGASLTGKIVYDCVL